jgi:DNA-binding transcriptional MerR regulator
LLDRYYPAFYPVSESIVGNEEHLGSELERSHGRASGELLSTGEMARRTATTLRTVRFYEAEGLLEPAQRTDGGHRLFPRSELDKLCLIGELRQGGLSLDEIRQLLSVKTGTHSGGEASALAREQLDAHIRTLSKRVAAINQLVGELRAVQSALAGCARCTDGERFPNDCANCHVMKSNPELPSALAVIWGVER